MNDIGRGAKVNEENGRMKRMIKGIALVVLAACLIYGWHEYLDYTAVPTARLAPGSYYPQMPPDEHHHYLQIPVDHGNPAMGNFTDFYILSPDFKQGESTVFWLFDNQQEAVGMISKAEDFDYFNASLGGLSYVLIGNRGVSPTLFPEVFNKDGSVNYSLALRLYGSDQQVDDIEAVRQDMQSKGLLPKDGKIMVYGRSGGGVLVQQYLDKYGEHVSRALIEASGAPDLALAHNTTFMKSIYESNPEIANSYFELVQKGDASPSLAYILFRSGLEGKTDLQSAVINSTKSPFAATDKLVYLANWIKPYYNFPLISFLMSMPSELEVKVRIYEVTAADLDRYNPTSSQEVCMGYEWIKVLLADFMKAHADGAIPIPRFPLNRSSYEGEVMVWSGTEDQDFDVEMGRWIADAYPHARLAVFEEIHGMKNYPEYYRDFRKAYFAAGLSSPETERYFKDPRQLNQQANQQPL